MKFSGVDILDLDLVPEFNFICNWHFGLGLGA